MTGLLYAEREGFEPSIPLRVYYLSRVANSTALAPLHKLRIKYTVIFSERKVYCFMFANPPFFPYTVYRNKANTDKFLSISCIKSSISQSSCLLVLLF